MKKLDKSPATGAMGLKSKVMIFFIVVAFFGTVLYYYEGNTLLGGLGLSGSLFSLVSFFHFKKETNRKTDKVDTTMTIFFFCVIVLGILVIFGNKLYEGPDFYYGIAGAMSMIAGIAYGLELMLTWEDSVK